MVKLPIFLAGFVFAIGLGISGMTDANKVVGFLNLGDWDPTLAFVMGGAVGVHRLLYGSILKRSSPLLGAAFQIPSLKQIDRRLVLGSAIFGVGWGIGGICPGPGIVSSTSLSTESLVFVAAMLAGMAVFHLGRRMLPSVEAQSDVAAGTK